MGKQERQKSNNTIMIVFVIFILSVMAFNPSGMASFTSDWAASGLLTLFVYMVIKKRPEVGSDKSGRSRIDNVWSTKSDAYKTQTATSMLKFVAIAAIFFMGINGVLGNTFYPTFENFFLSIQKGSAFVLVAILLGGFIYLNKDKSQSHSDI